jgi:hypothetical protein
MSHATPMDEANAESAPDSKTDATTDSATTALVTVVRRKGTASERRRERRRLAPRRTNQTRKERRMQAHQSSSIAAGQAVGEHAHAKNALRADCSDARLAAVVTQAAVHFAARKRTALAQVRCRCGLVDWIDRLERERGKRLRKRGARRELPENM